jgi:hypothetical protein
MAAISGHIHRTSPATATVDPAWNRWSTAWTKHIPVLTGRTDLTVTVAPGAGHGAPACYIPSRAAVEVDADLIGDPTITDPRKPGHKKHVPAVYGALVHEAAHAVHSLWTTPPGAAPVVATVAEMLEESRVEGAHRRRRPRDRKWIRHCVTTIVAAEDAPTDTVFNAAYAAGLLLARVDAGILTPADVRPVRRAVTRVLGRRRLARLRQIWRAAHLTADTDATAMIEHARQWCLALGIDPDTSPLPPDPQAGASSTISTAIGAVIGTVAGTAPPSPTSGGTRTKAGAGRGGVPALPEGLQHYAATPASWTLRPPTSSEQQAAARLTAMLRRARSREPVMIREASATPPGRLRTRQAMTAAAQRAAGAVPTAQPWQRTARQPVPDPELTVAVLVDVSGSMSDFAAPMSSAAWILAQATSRAGGTAATIAFGQAVTIITAPGHRPGQVREILAEDGTEVFDEAVAVADQLLHLTTPGAARLVVIVSDGQFYANGFAAAQATINRLLTAGCGVLCLTPESDYIHTYTGPTTIPVPNPADCITLIGRAAARALAHH